jgi:hypothetical protein
MRGLGLEDGLSSQKACHPARPESPGYHFERPRLIGILLEIPIGKNLGP